MSKNCLTIGTLLSGQPFTLPIDLVTHTLAIMGIRGSGKTIAATVIAEEMCEAGLPWVALDPVGVWWGLRAKPDGTPGGYPVVIIGGEHADLPLEKSAGPRVAEAILQENVSCVVDLSGESKNTCRHFIGEFCDRLMELRPSNPRHIFIEEAPEFVPQKPMGEQKRSLAAARRERDAALSVLAEARSVLEPQYLMMQRLFGSLDAVSTNGHADSGIYAPWKAKLGDGCAAMIDALVAKGTLTTPQLATLSGLAPRTIANNLIVLRRNGLVESVRGKCHSLRSI